ncbi:MAG: S9 family peptidase [bacterium]|nr:S9 family peptidase [bacterium]
MTKFTGFFILCLVSCFLLFAGGDSFKYPVTKKSDHVDDYFGTKVSDPYRWLEDTDLPAVAEWVEAQNKVTADYFDRIPFNRAIKKRLTQIFDYEKCTPPAKVGKYYVTEKKDTGKELAAVYIQKDLKEKPRLLIDPNTFSADGSVILKGYTFSKNQKYVCYTISRGGADWTEFFVMEVETGKKLKDHIKWVKFSEASWFGDGFFYSRFAKLAEPGKLKEKTQAHTLYYHKLGTPQSADKVALEDKTNPRLFFFGEVVGDEKFLVVTGYISPAVNLLYCRSLETDNKILPLIDKPIGFFKVAGVIGDRLLVHTNYKAPNYRAILIDPKKPQIENWEEVIPGSGVKMEWVAYVGGRLVVSYLKDVITVLSVFDTGGKKLHDIDLPGMGTVFAINGSGEDNEAFYTYSSYTDPPAIYRYLVKENRSELYRKTEVNFDPGLFETRRVFYKSKDGTRVPMFIVHKKGLKLDGNNPALLFGYGGFNLAMRPDFSYNTLVNIPLLENGGIYAVACIRGGGEYGEAWHRAGMLEKKQNGFDDFIAGAEYLIKAGYTNSRRLGIFSSSNGGLLVGAVVNQRPDLFAAAVAAVPVMDMLRYHNFSIAWTAAVEYGSSRDPEQFKYLYKYSPLHNIKKGLEYPAVLVSTAEHDDRAFPAHSYKYIATLQEKYHGKNPTLLRVYKQMGHNLSGTTKMTEFYSDIIVFILHNTGVKRRINY